MVGRFTSGWCARKEKKMEVTYSKEGGFYSRLVPHLLSKRCGATAYAAALSCWCVMRNMPHACSVNPKKLWEIFQRACVIFQKFTNDCGLIKGKTRKLRWNQLSSTSTVTGTGLSALKYSSHVVACTMCLCPVPFHLPVKCVEHIMKSMNHFFVASPVVDYTSPDLRPRHSRGKGSQSPISGVVGAG